MFRKRERQEADACIVHVDMLKRINYGTASVRVTYSVEPSSGSAFEVVQEAKVKMAVLPQAGQRLKVRFDPEHPDRLEVLTPPGEETGEITERTKELPYDDWRMPYATESEVQHVRERVQAQHSDAIIQQLQQLAELRDSGVLTEQEFQAQKARVLSQD
jgi:hypothetical protein